MIPRQLARARLRRSSAVAARSSCSRRLRARIRVIDGFDPADRRSAARRGDYLVTARTRATPIWRSAIARTRPLRETNLRPGSRRCPLASPVRSSTATTRTGRGLSSDHAAYHEVRRPKCILLLRRTWRVAGQEGHTRRRQRPGCAASCGCQLPRRRGGQPVPYVQTHVHPSSHRRRDSCTGATARLALNLATRLLRFGGTQTPCAIRIGFEAARSASRPPTAMLPDAARPLPRRGLSLTPAQALVDRVRPADARCTRTSTASAAASGWIRRGRPENCTLACDNVVADSGVPGDQASTAARLHPVHEVPDECLPFLLASRYCEVDSLSQMAWDLFGRRQLTPGRAGG